MADIDGFKICGKRGGKPFVDAIRPNSEGACPSNTVKCSPFTSLENTICTEDVDLGDCPVTYLRLLKPNQEVQDVIVDNVDPVSFIETPEFKLVYSKGFDSLPIQST